MMPLSEHTVGGRRSLTGFTYGFMRGLIYGIFRKEDVAGVSGPAIAAGVLISLAGFTIVGVSYVADVIDSPLAAKRYNRRHGLESNFRLLPVLFVYNRDVRVGLMGSLNF